MRIIDLRVGALPENLMDLLPRPKIDTTAAVEIVKPIVADVQHRGATAIYDLNERFDGVRPQSLLVPREALRCALADLDPEVTEALKVSISNARRAHEAQLPQESVTEVIPGGVVFQRWVPLGRVGLYVPGGLAVYPSSVVMNVVTAQVAGVKSMVVATPPQKEFGGLPHPTILAACELLGVSEVIAVGGAQAIAAMAHGFQDGDYRCAPVDKVTGPGNVYVAAAKRLVQSVCGIDSEAGTTEIAILADESANPPYVCADLISQAEHDPAAASVLFTDSSQLASVVEALLPQMVARTPEKERVATALSGPQSAIVITKTLEDALNLTQAYAPEHLEIHAQNALELSHKITTAGAVFVGDYTPVPLGDYVAGSNHVLPTGGTARYSAGLNVTQFLRSMQVVDYSKEALRAVLPALVTLANAEGLPAHGQAAQIRFEGEESGEERREEGDEGAQTDAVLLPVRADLADVEPYGAPMIEVPARLNVNENPFAPSDQVADSIAEAVREATANLNRYADRDATQLRVDLAQYVSRESGVAVEDGQVWAANGSNEIMLQLLQAFGGPGRTALGVWPTYSMYMEYARDTFTNWVLVGGPGADPQVLPSFDADVWISAMRRENPAVVFVPSPNNPTGEPVDNADLQKILDASKDTGPLDERGRRTATIVILDEAYGEFREPGTPSAMECLAANPNLVVTRTMSKAFAAAGLRLGYLVASPQIVYEVQKVRLPYHLSLITQAAARAALTHADSQLAQVGLIRTQRELLRDWLVGEGFTVAPSSSNFLLFGPLSDRHATWEALVERGVLIREVGPQGYLRVTVGTPQENEMFKAALKESL